MKHRIIGRLSLIWIIFTGVIAFLGWAAIFEIDETVRAQGQIIPSAKTQIVQSADGGVISEILVHEGQTVVAGQRLAYLEPDRSAASVAEVRAKLNAVKAALVRARAEANASRPQFRGGLLEYPEFVATQLSLFEQKEKTLATELDTLRHTLAAAREELRINEELLATGDTSYLEVSRAKRQVRELLGKIDYAQNKFRQDALAEVTKLEEELALVNSKLEERTSVLEHTTILAPASGVVKYLRINTVGGVLRPGDEIMQISPTEGGVVVEAKVNPADIGRLLPGLAATVRLDAYDYASYGSMAGKVSYISSDTLTDQQSTNGQLVTYYRAHIQLDHASLKSSPRLANLEIKPGMTATVDITTGQRTVLEYLAKPVARAFTGAMSER
jgi:adhesin transport system membrane fusion protein